jgi:hypothetical protein
MRRVSWASETYRDLALVFVSLLVIYVGRPVLCRQEDAHRIQVTLYYSLEPHQLPKFLALFLWLTMMMMMMIMMTQAIKKRRPKR